MRDGSDKAAGKITPIQPLLMRCFRFIGRRRIRGSFSALRVAHLQRFPQPTGPLIVYLNHPSWWDPLISIVLAPNLIGHRNFYGPIDAEALKRYGILRRLGVFPVEIETRRGAAQFLKAAEAVLARGEVLAITPQGRFTDARARPPALRAGLGVLLARLQRSGTPVTVVPLAMEYTFWNERTPEALVCVGEPLNATGETPHRSSAAWTNLLEQRLTAAQDELAALAATRDATDFTTLLQGRTDLAGFYGVWQKLTGRARMPRD